MKGLFRKLFRLNKRRFGRDGQAPKPPILGALNWLGILIAIILSWNSLVWSAPSTFNTARQQYDLGNLPQALQLWQQGLTSAATAPEQIPIYHALAIVYQDLAQWSEAKTVISQAQQLLLKHPNSFLSAQNLNIQGTLWLNLGDYNLALLTWQQSEALYQKLQDTWGIALSQINQAQALQALGQQNQARSLLEQIQIPPNAPTLQANLGLRLGIALQVLGDRPGAKTQWENSLAQAPPDLKAELLNHLGQWEKEQGNLPQALDDHKQAHHLARSPRIQLESLIQQFPVLVATQRRLEAQKLLIEARSLLATAPSSRWAIESAIYLANRALNGLESLDPGAIKPLLDRALLQATNLGDARSLATVQGTLGYYYERRRELPKALNLTQLALQRVEALGRSDLRLPLQWQVGRILQQQGNLAEARLNYAQAVADLAILRKDLAAGSLDVQFSFRDQVEPIYREYVQLLLQGLEHLDPEQHQQRLVTARNTLEALQLAELQNFLREACPTDITRPLDQIDPHAAVIYPIVLDGSIEVITAFPKALPNSPNSLHDNLLQHHSFPLPRAKVTQVVKVLRASLNPEISADNGLLAAQRLYDWLLRPMEGQFKKNEIKTLLFVSDSILRDIPMSLLHDGDRYLIENYNIALQPGLQLFNAQPVVHDAKSSAVFAGLSLTNQGFAALPNVETELQSIAQLLPSQTLLNQNFNQAKLQENLDNRHPSVVHLATHGQFSSNPEKTFLLTWNGRMNLPQIRQLLQKTEHPIDLLVLSACQTAKGDDRAILGLAGLAVRSGAASTIATLWNVNDRSTADLMINFYRAWQMPGTTRSSALRQAQLSILQDPHHGHPYYWAGIVLVGQWN
jgi:CHAT domain-containing protein